MRYAAVEAGATRDPELVRERDEAIRRLNTINDALERERCFFCHDCMSLISTTDRALEAGGLSWCMKCAPARVG
jgi:hypothetical protein